MRGVVGFPGQALVWLNNTLKGTQFFQLLFKLPTSLVSSSSGKVWSKSRASDSGFSHWKTPNY